VTKNKHSTCHPTPK